MEAQGIWRTRKERTHPEPSMTAAINRKEKIETSIFTGIAWYIDFMKKFPTTWVACCRFSLHIQG